MLQILQPECMMGDLTYGGHHQYTSTYPLPASSEAYSHALPQAGLLSQPEMGSYGMQMSTYGAQMMPMTVPSSREPLRHRSFPSLTGTGFLDSRSAFAQGPVRRRISRACDQCNQLRTKCDGKLPCAHCVDFSLKCAYNRERKKRGKASRKDIARQKAAAAASGEPSESKAKSADKAKTEQKPLPQTGSASTSKASSKPMGHARKLSAILPSPAPPASSGATSNLSALMAPQQMSAQQRQHHRHTSHSSIHSMHQHMGASPPGLMHVSAGFATPINQQAFTTQSLQPHLTGLTATPPYPQDGSEQLAYTSPVDQQVLFQNAHMHSPSFNQETIDPSFSDPSHLFAGSSPQFTTPMQRSSTFPNQTPEQLISYNAADASPYQSPTFMGGPSMHPHAQQLPTPQPQLSAAEEGLVLSHSMSTGYDMNAFARMQATSGAGVAPMRRATIAHIQAPTYDQFSLLSPTSQHEPPASAGGLQVTTSDHSPLQGLLLSSLDDQQGWLALPSPPPTSYPPDSFTWSS